MRLAVETAEPSSYFRLGTEFQPNFYITSGQKLGFYGRVVFLCFLYIESWKNIFIIINYLFRLIL